MNITYTTSATFSNTLTGDILIDDRETPYHFKYFNSNLTIKHNDDLVSNTKFATYSSVTSLKLETQIEKEIIRHVISNRMHKLDKI